MFRTAAIEPHLPWDDSLPYVIDLDMYTRVLADGPGVAIRASLAQFRMATASWSASLSGVQRLQFDGWRDRAVATGLLDLSPSELLRSRLMASLQHGRRRAAYRVTAIRRRRRPETP